MCQLVSAAIRMPHMQGCMYSLKIVVPGMSIVILLPACQLNRGLKLKLQLRAYIIIGNPYSLQIRERYLC